MKTIFGAKRCDSNEYYKPLNSLKVTGLEASDDCIFFLTENSMPSEHLNTVIDAIDHL